MNPHAAEESPPTRSTLSRLLATPLRDVVRGRVTGRLDRQKLIAEAQLAGRLGQLVSDVVRRTRLFRLEKVAVAEELIAHFHDGLEAGRSAEELATAFGDPQQAGRLIGRAKRRNRSLTWRATLRAVQVTGGGLAMVVLLYSLAAARFVLGRPSPSSTPWVVPWANTEGKKAARNRVCNRKEMVKARIAALAPRELWSRRRRGSQIKTVVTVPWRHSPPATVAPPKKAPNTKKNMAAAR